MIDRRLFVSGLGGALVAAGCSPTIGLAQASGKQLRVTHAVTSLAYIQSYIAQQKGYFSQAGLMHNSLIPAAAARTFSSCWVDVRK
jgi:hypothetical protein